MFFLENNLGIKVIYRKIWAAIYTHFKYFGSKSFRGGSPPFSANRRQWVWFFGATAPAPELH